MIFGNPIHGPKVGFLIGIGPRTDASTLDLDALNVVRQKDSAFEEEFMVIPTSVSATRQPLKAVEIQLAFERAESALAKVQRDNLFEELVWLVNRKGSAVGNKRDDIGSATAVTKVEREMDV